MQCFTGEIAIFAKEKTLKLNTDGSYFKVYSTLGLTDSPSGRKAFIFKGFRDFCPTYATLFSLSFYSPRSRGFFHGELTFPDFPVRRATRSPTLHGTGSAGCSKSPRGRSIIPFSPLSRSPVGRADRSNSQNSFLFRESGKDSPS